ncbi:DNA cytosine methyltransferase [Salmonella enterica subsp. enterica serovar Weslaco]|uniref:DNA cytosine methyltransferase n=1 Tax=Salmonella enterica subsp. enterica serovar Weslaco TaxID=1243597 RepID=A0A5X3P9H3_SALET|nr:DNA cytosine methyltransferase [Salmonella enterica]EBZ5931454.1 DNA cytosine methyltransferase [Salmonella enterica subsp. enterica serovar Weslaco]EBP7910792.1 DNA cytosine methyltransferase [Salmonella enterica]EBP7911087.1 DNA cytosine methyltransferase [Salmonella enterica]EBZ6054498.1 DNA cytosine methyltransferase [Salmonella enterica subsp. enterica serovar Weslaco]
MVRGAYYNEIDPNAAQWLRNLIAAGHITPGEVDERSIEDVAPDDLRGFTQCHFFAGIGVWSYALRLAGWPDNKQVWTGSCPCQPFSSAGKGAGFDDERHLWPALFHLISERRPELVFGEQVAGVNAWFDLVQTDVEAVDYAFGLVPFPAAGVGAPHIRDRAYWVADASGERSQRWRKRLNSIEEDVWRSSTARQPLAQLPEGLCPPGGMVHPNLQHQSTIGNKTRTGNLSRAIPISGLAESSGEQYQNCLSGRRESDSAPAGRTATEFAGLCLPERVADGDDDRQQSSSGQGSRGQEYRTGNDSRRRSENLRPNTIYGSWDDADWLLCRDGRWRPVESGTFPLAHGITARVGRLRAYGNAIVAPAAATFIRSFMECAGYDLI